MVQKDQKGSPEILLSWDRHGPRQRPVTRCPANYRGSHLDNCQCQCKLCGVWWQESRTLTQVCIHHRRAAAGAGEAAQSAAAREEDSSSWCLSSRSSNSSSSGGQTTVLPVNKNAFLHVQHLRFAILDHVLSFIRSGTHKLNVSMLDALGKAMDIFIKMTKWPWQVRE